MARDDEASALELHIKVNGQNLSAISEKCHIGTLRPPSDPSWPKIPLRRLNHNTDDIIEPPCVVTLIGTPRKGCSIVRAGTCQHTRPRLSQKYEVPTHIPKRLPGSIDPRFKRQISRQKTEQKPDESCDTKNGKQTSEMNMCVLREIKKPEDSLQGTIKSMDNYTRYNADKISESVTKKGTTDCPIKEQFVSEADHRKTSIPEHNAKNSNDIPGNKSISCCKMSDWIHEKENVNSSVSLNQDTVNETLLVKSHHENFKTLDNADNVNKDGGSFSNMTTTRRLKTVAEQKYNTDNLCIADGYGIERKALSETRIAKISLRPNTLEQKLVYHEKNSRVGLDESSSTIVMNNKMLKKDIVFNEVQGKECDNENEEKYEELRVNVKRKMAPINLSRKAKSFFRKKSRLAITDSDCTLILPGSRHVKGKQYERTRLKVSQLLHRRNGMNGTNSVVRIKSNNAKQKHQVNSCSLTNLQAKGDLFEEPSSIPLETQELLNQSYWEYYWRLRRKIALANKPDNAGKRDKSRPSESRERLPESQTLQQCSVLSCMINTALRDTDGRSSSDPVVATFNARENICLEASGLSSGVFAKKVKRRKTKRASKRLLGLRTIALLGTTIYVAVIFLPMMYDYFFDEEYENDYENTNYIGLALQYVASSFGEAFDGIVDVLNTLLLRPRSCGKCNNVI